MLADVVELLVCPNCGADLASVERSLRCGNGHVFDVARQGYVNLLGGDVRPRTADTAEMVEARARFLRSGHFRGIADAVAEAAARASARIAPSAIVDVGAGTGCYLARVLDRLPASVGLALDISKYAARRAAHAHERIGAIVCDVWRPLPVRTGAASLVLDVFAPRNAPEIRRILRPGGALIVVTPTQHHLEEIVSALGLLSVDERKQQRLDEKVGPYFTQVESVTHEETMSLSREDLAVVASMGPSAWHMDRAVLEARIAECPERMSVTASATVSVFR